MPEVVQKFLAYWSLTIAVVFFFLFAFVVAGFDVWAQIRENVRKRRGQIRAAGRPADLNPLAGQTVAGTIGMGPGQRPDATRQWILDVATAIAQKLNLSVRILVLEDSKNHPFIHFHDGRQLKTYRVDKTWVAEARAGNAEREAQIRDLIERYLAADFLGMQEMRPKRTTELAREAASKQSTQSAQSTPSTQSKESGESSAG
ncbi:MAG TPA: hypothetical protein VJA65_00170 [bacterium]|nr:hypothetical protein [bacterium]